MLTISNQVSVIENNQMNMLDFLKRTLNGEHFIKYFLNSFETENTRINYEIDIKQCIRYFYKTDILEDISIMDLQRLDIPDVNGYKNYLTNLGLSNASMGRKLSAMSSLYKFYMKYNNNVDEIIILKINPFTLFTKEMSEKVNRETRNRVLEKLNSGNETDVKKMLKSIDRGTIEGKRNYCLFALLFAIGMRKTELINLELKKDIIPLEDGSIRLFLRKTKNKDVRVINVAPKYKNIIVDYLSSENRSLDSEGYLFHGKNNRFDRAMGESSVNYLLNKTLEDNNMKHIKVHEIRHQSICQMIDDNVNLTEIRQQVGHRSTRMIESYMTHRNNTYRAGANLDL